MVNYSKEPSISQSLWFTAEGREKIQAAAGSFSHEQISIVVDRCVMAGLQAGMLFFPEPDAVAYPHRVKIK